MKHMLFCLSLLVAASALEACSSSSDAVSGMPEYRCIVSGYSNAVRIATANPADYPYLKLPSRIYCFGISPDKAGNWYVDPVRERNQATVRRAMNPGQEAFLVVGGGATAGNMYTMGTDPLKRAAFAEAVVDYAHEKGFDGIDVDWETDWSVTPFLHVPIEEMAALLAAIRSRMETLPADTKLRLLTAALSSNTMGQELGGHIAAYVDQINVMIYDTYGTEEEGYPHAPMRVLKASLAGYAAHGVPNDKIIVGIPFYGGDKSVFPVVTQPYNTLCAMADGAITPASNSYGRYAFNGVDLVKEKTRYVLDNGYAGITVWELSHDVSYDNPLSLLRAINSVARKN